MVAIRHALATPASRTPRLFPDGRHQKAPAPRSQTPPAAGPDAAGGARRPAVCRLENGACREIAAAGTAGAGGRPGPECALLAPYGSAFRVGRPSRTGGRFDASPGECGRQPRTCGRDGTAARAARFATAAASRSDTQPLRIAGSMLRVRFPLRVAGRSGSFRSPGSSGSRRPCRCRRPTPGCLCTPGPAEPSRQGRRQGPD